MAKSTIVGMGDLSKSFKKLTSDMTTRVARAMVVSAGKVLKDEAKALALGYGLRRTGSLIRNIAIKRNPSKEGTTAYNLGVRHGRNLNKKQKAVSKLGRRRGRIVSLVKDDPYYWRFHELGWTSKGGKKHTATPFISKALTNKAAQAIRAMELRLEAELKKSQKVTT